MPVNGLLAKWDKLHLSLGVSASIGGGTNPGYAAEAQFFYTPDAIDINVGVDLDIQATASRGWTATYNGPSAPSGGYSVGGSGVPSSTVIDVYFIDYLLYGTNNAKFYVSVSSIEIYINGTLSVTLGGFTATSNALGPSWVPIFAGFFQVDGSCGTGGGSATVSATISGGWRYQIAGVWYAPPALPPPPSVEPATSGTEAPPPHSIVHAPFDLSIVETILTTSTYGPQLYCIQSLVTASGGTVFVSSESAGGSVVVIPNLPKAIVRMNTDFAATFFAFASPQCQGAATRIWGHRYPPSTPPIPDYAVTTIAATNVATRTAAATQEVGASVSALESFFANPSYSMGSMSHSKMTVASDGTTDSESIQCTYPNTMDSESGSESWSSGAYPVAPYMSHADIRANYFNSAVCHPHWSIGYYTGPWTLMGASTTWEQYWGPVREQFLSAQGRRNHIVSCPLESSGYTPFLDAYFLGPPTAGTSYGMRWIGVCRWQTQSVTPAASLSPDSTSSSAWSIESSTCTLAFGSTVTITPASGITVCKFDLDLARFDCLPFFYAELAASVLLNWPSTNISQVEVFAVSEDGITSTLFELNPTDGFTTPNKTYPITYVADTKYAGSWGIDNGAGFISDVGTDVATGGVSPAIMSDARRQLAFALTTGTQIASLHYQVTVVDPTQPCEIDYPQFNAATSKLLIQENGQIADVVYQNGPGLRFTNHVWYNGMFLEPPGYSGLGYKPSVIDWLCDKRILLMGVGPTGGTPSLTTECTQLYDPFEGQSIGQVDDDSITFLLPPNPSNINESAWKAALVNTWSEVPPLAGFPTFDRSLTDWTLTTSPTQKVWALAQLPRRICNPHGQLDLQNPSGVVVTIASSLSIPGWSISEHTAVVNNSESVNWAIVKGTKTWADTRPWHGWYANIWGAQLSPLAYDVSRQLRHGRITIQDGSTNLWVGTSSNGNPYGWVDLDSGIASQRARIRWRENADEPLGLLYNPTGGAALDYVLTPDEGSTFGSTMTIATTLATNGFFDFDETGDFNRWFYWQEGSSAPYTIYNCIVDAQGNVIRARIATNITNSDLAPIAVREFPVDGGGRSIGLLYSTSGTTKYLTARDGITFS